MCEYVQYVVQRFCLLELQDGEKFEQIGNAFQVKGELLLNVALLSFAIALLTRCFTSCGGCFSQDVIFLHMGT